jgi:uncharacterized protein YecA (UPF0149 family)
MEVQIVGEISEQTLIGKYTVHALEQKQFEAQLAILDQKKTEGTFPFTSDRRKSTEWKQSRTSSLLDSTFLL